MADLLAPAHLDLNVDGQVRRVEIPFICAKFRTVVRVVDFFPNRLEDFAYSRRVSEYDALSNCGEDSTSDLDSASDDDDDRGSRIWEWRFSLRLEEATDQRTSSHKKNFWVVVDNMDAQLLLSLDACEYVFLQMFSLLELAACQSYPLIIRYSLHRDQDARDNLRERLFVLWGDLEERKAARALAGRVKRVGRPNPTDRPSLDSSGDEDFGSIGPSRAEVVANRPFACCVRQYGIKVVEKDPRRADAGRGWKWKRMHGLFGTKISVV